MQDKLRAAFSKKEKAEMFLANLEDLKEEKNIGDSQYRVLKIEYNQMRDDAISEVNSIKNVIKKELDTRLSKLEALKHELSYLEARFKVGQLSSDTYLAKEKGPKRQATELEKRISELQTFLNATGSTELGIHTDSGRLLGLNLGFSKKPPAAPPSPGAPAAPAAGQTASPPASLPPPSPTSPPPPPIPSPPPPVTRVANLQIMPPRVMERGSVGIIVTVANIVMGNVQQKVELKINGEVKDSRDLNLMPGESQEITFITSADKPGNYQVEVGGATGAFEVIDARNVRYLR